MNNQMKNKIISTTILACLTMIQINILAQDTSSVSDSVPVAAKFKGEFCADMAVCIPFMPKMTNIFIYGVHTGFKISDNFPLIKGFFKTGGYVNNFNNSKLKHTMVFSGNTSSEVEVVYDNSIVLWGVGLKQVTRQQKKSRPFFEGDIGMVHIRNNLHLQSGGISYDNLPDSWTKLNRDRAPIFKLGMGIELGKPEKQVAFFAAISYMGSFRPVNYTHHKFMELQPRPTSQSGGTDVFMDFIDYEELPSNVYNHKVAELYSYPLQLLNFSVGLSFR